MADRDSFWGTLAAIFELFDFNINLFGYNLNFKSIFLVVFMVSIFAFVVRTFLSHM